MREVLDRVCRETSSQLIYPEATIANDSTDLFSNILLKLWEL